MHGRSPLGEDGAPRESHLILLDNGRTRMRQDPLMREGLNCIRCAACMNICPTYGVVGGHTFGHIYPGPIGIPWTAATHGLDIAGGFAELCVSCGLCKEICPAKIDMPLMISQVKQEYYREHDQPPVNKLMMQAETQARLGSAFAPLSNWLMENPLFRLGMEKFAGIDRRRKLPPFARRTLAKWWARRQGSAALPIALASIFASHAASNCPRRSSAGSPPKISGYSRKNVKAAYRRYTGADSSFAMRMSASRAAEVTGCHAFMPSSDSWAKATIRSQPFKTKLQSASFRDSVDTAAAHRDKAPPMAVMRSGEPVVIAPSTNRSATPSSSA